MIIIYVQQHTILKLSFTSQIRTHVSHVLIWKSFHVLIFNAQNVYFPTLVEMKKYTQGKLVSAYLVT